MKTSADVFPSCHCVNRNDPDQQNARTSALMEADKYMWHLAATFPLDCHGSKAYLVHLYFGLILVKYVICGCLS